MLDNSTSSSIFEDFWIFAYEGINQTNFRTWLQFFNDEGAFEMERVRRVIVFAPSLKTLGGGEYFVLKVVKSLKDLGFNVELVTVEKPNRTLLEEYFGESLMVSPKQIMLSPKLAHAKYLRDLLVYVKLAAKWGDSVLFNAMANEIAFPSHISYIHALHFARPILENAPLKGRNLIGGKIPL
jgi:hypothetical protein